MLQQTFAEGEPIPGTPLPAEFSQLLTVETKPWYAIYETPYTGPEAITNVMPPLEVGDVAPVIGAPAGTTTEILRQLDAEVMNGPLPSPGTMIDSFGAEAVAPSPEPVAWLGLTAGTWLLLGVGALLLFGRRR